MSKDKRVSNHTKAKKQQGIDAKKARLSNYRYKQSPELTGTFLQGDAGAVTYRGQRSDLLSQSDNDHQDDFYTVTELTYDENIDIGNEIHEDEKQDLIESIIQDVVASLHKQLKSYAAFNHIDINFSGSTALFVVHILDHLFIVSLGDSGAHWYEADNEDLHQLSIGHSLGDDYNPDEVTRAKPYNFMYPEYDSNGNLIAARLASGLQPTRGFGDEDSLRCGLSQEPEVVCQQIKENDLLLIYTDGLSDYVHLGGKTDPHDAQTTLNTIKSSVANQKNPLEIATAVCEQALNNGTHDNTTGVVVKLKKLALNTIRLYAVFDGHGKKSGAKISRFLSDNFANTFQAIIKLRFLKIQSTNEPSNTPTAIFNNPPPYQEYEQDLRRSLTIVSFDRLLNDTFAANPSSTSISTQKWGGTAYEKNNRLLFPMSCAHEVHLRILSEKLREKQPSAVIIPIMENKYGCTLYIDKIQYNADGKITSCDVTYYDPLPKNPISIRIQKSLSTSLENILGKGCVKKKTNSTPKNNNPHINLNNMADSPYWTYLYCCQLLNKGTIDFNTDYLTNEQINLLFIYKTLQENKSGTQNWINEAEELYQLLLKEAASLKRTAAINVLYEIMHLSEVKKNIVSADTEKLITDTKKLFDPNLTEAEIKAYMLFGEQYKQKSGMQALGGSVLVLGGIAILTMTICGIVPLGASTVVIAELGDITLKMLTLIAWYIAGSSSTCVGAYNMYRGCKGNWNEGQELTNALTKFSTETQATMPTTLKTNWW